MDQLQTRDNTSKPLEPAPAESLRRREQELEAQIAELKQDKDRLLTLLDQALTCLNRYTEHAPDGLLPLSSPLPTQKAVTKTKKEIPLGSWARLKDWFLNA